MSNTIGDAIRSAVIAQLESRDCSQLHASREMGVPIATLHDYLAGKRKKVGDDVLTACAKWASIKVITFGKNGISTK